MFLIWKVNGMVDVFCSIVAYMCGGEWNITVCCDTILPYETEMTRLVCGVLHTVITEQ